MAFANPHLPPSFYSSEQPEPEWIFVETITGNQSQTVNILVPTVHWRVSGTYIVFAGQGEMGLYIGAAMHRDIETPRLGVSETYWIELENFARGQNQLRIEVTNVERYALTVEYDNASIVPASASNAPPSTNATTPPSTEPSPNLTPSPSPTVPEFTPAAVLVLVSVTGLVAVAFRERRRLRSKSRKVEECV